MGDVCNYKRCSANLFRRSPGARSQEGKKGYLTTSPFLTPFPFEKRV
jgi:hypothetical protein